MKKTTFLILSVALCTLLCVVTFPLVAPNPITFSQWAMNKEATMEKYKNDWNNFEIKKSNTIDNAFKLGDFVATITIPAMNIYELPIYNGSTDITTNWQITTPGHAGNWSLFGEQGVSSVGAHNYQLFKELPSLKAGDKILIETTLDRYVYVVDSFDIYHHATDNWNVVATKHASDYALNLMTCYPIDAIKTDDMYIVYTTIQKGTVIGT